MLIIGWCADEKNDRVKEQIRKKVSEYLSRMEAIKKELEGRRNEPPKKQAHPTSGGGKYGWCSASSHAGGPAL